MKNYLAAALAAGTLYTGSAEAQGRKIVVDLRLTQQPTKSVTYVRFPDNSRALSIYDPYRGSQRNIDVSGNFARSRQQAERRLFELEQRLRGRGYIR